MHINSLLELKENDHPTFTKHCETIIQHQLQIWKPKELVIVNVDFCFDKRYCFDTEKEIFYEHDKEIFAFSSCQDRLTITRSIVAMDAPFSIYERNYRGYLKVHIPDYIEKRKLEKPKFYQRDDIKSREYHFKPLEDALIVWYSGQTKINGRGALMFHFMNPVEFQAFHVTLSENESWGVSESFGIFRKEINDLILNREK